MPDPAVGSILHTQASAVLQSTMLASWLWPPLGPNSRRDCVRLAAPLALLSSPAIRQHFLTVCETIYRAYLIHLFKDEFTHTLYHFHQAGLLARQHQWTFPSGRLHLRYKETHIHSTWHVAIEGRDRFHKPLAKLRAETLST